MQVTKDITELSAAAFLKEVGKKCPVTARLSTVVHEKGCGIHPIDLFTSLCSRFGSLPACVVMSWQSQLPDQANGAGHLSL